MVRSREIMVQQVDLFDDDAIQLDRSHRRRGDDRDRDETWWSGDGSDAEEVDERRRDKTKNAWKRQRRRDDEYSF
jgi:hypothetical protein